MTSPLAWETLLSLIVQVGVVVWGTALLERRVRGSATVCQLWTVSFVAILALLAAGLLFPHPRWIAVPQTFSGSTILSVLGWQTFLLQGCLLFWGVGFAAVVARRVVRCLLLWKFLARDCRPLSSEERASLPCPELAAELDVQWLLGTNRHGPFCWQLHRPTIVLPQYALEEDRRTLRHLVLHELEHLRTRHPLQHFLQGLCGAILWFHPAAWWARRRAELAREYLCDEVAATSDGSVAAYLRTLASVAQRSRAPLGGTLAFGRGKSAIQQRGQRLVELAEAPAVASRGRSAGSLIALLLVVAAASQLWLPINLLASSRSRWSPWPRWTAQVLHDFGVPVRDFERFEARQGLHELRESPP